MKEIRVGRIHWRDTLSKVEDYPDSPHVLGAIRDGKLTECGLNTERIALAETEVTCKACLAIMESKKPENQCLVITEFEA